jgi:hypothetical protein
MRTGRSAGLGLLVAVFAVHATQAEEHCDKTRHPTFDFWMVARDTRAYFYSGPGNEIAAPARLKGFVLRGDLVHTSQPDNNLRATESPPFVCGIYYGTNGSKSYGWLRKRDLLALGLHVGNSLNDEEPEPSSDLRDLLSRLPPIKSWPAAGISADPCHHENNFTGDFVCVRRIDLESKELCVTTTHRDYGLVECGRLSLGNRYASFEAEGLYSAYLFNNGIAIISQIGMWGNHGQSDPSGLYVFSASANRACLGDIAPPLPGRKH